MLYRISDAIAHSDHKVSVTWSDGVTAEVDLSPVLATGPVFVALKDCGYFVKNMRVADDRLGLEWPNGVDFSADGLRFRAFPAEAAEEFGGASGRKQPASRPTHHAA